MSAPLARVELGNTLHSACGTAYEVRLVETTVPDWEATVATWFITAPGQSPAWDDYLLSIVHLRDLDGVPPANKRFNNMTHELVLFALDPTEEPKADDIGSWALLRPVNAVEQVELPDDDAARDLARMAAFAVVSGELPAEPLLSGQREPWHTAMIKTSAHLRGEEHAP